MKKTITALLLAALLTLPALAACSKDDGETSARSDASGTTSEEALPFEVKNFGGQEIHVIARSNHTYGEMQFVADEERRRFGVQDIYINYVGPVIGNHSGPGTLALFFLGSRR